MSMPAKYQLKPKVQDTYLKWVVTFPLTSIRSDEHLAAAQEMLDQLLARGRLDEGSTLYLEALSDLVAAYEEEHHALPPATDAELLRHLMEAKGISQADLHRDTGLAKSTISEVLAGKKPFSRQMIRKLATYFEVDTSLLSANL